MNKSQIIFLTTGEAQGMYQTVTTDCPRGVTLDLEAGTWCFRGETVTIGERWQRSLNWIPNFPLGVFDLSDPTQLQPMVDAVAYFTNEYVSALDG